MTAPASPTPRQQYEATMRALRRPCAVSEADSGPRAVPEAEHPYRTCFQRDRDRVVHCSAFRRLDFKTQVFVPHEHDHFRTRLTHTLEVAQVGRELARALRLNEDLVEAVALAHDLGHSPFGHGGEKVLDELMAAHGRFEHNRQSLRVVDTLEHPYPDFRGLNLTRVVRECLAKHATRYDIPLGEEFDTSEPAPIEGQLVDLADEIAYTAADLDDALGAGWITLEQLGRLELWRQAWQEAEAQHATARAIHKQIRATKNVLAALADDAVAATTEAIESLDLTSVDDVRRCGRRLAGFSPRVRAALDEFQAFLLADVYLTDQNTAQSLASQHIIRELFEAFVADPSLLPQRYGRRIDAAGPHRVVCDYIAGMTDRFCKAEHARVCGA